MMYIVGAVAILITMLLAIARALLGTATVLMIAFLGYLTGRPEWEDIALLYALINFIGTIAVMKFVKFSDLGGPRSGDHLGDL
jgi:multicomponent Na+:H+ antiporter subunit F